MKSIILSIVLVFSIFFLTVNSQKCVVCQDLAYVADLFVQYEGWNAQQLQSEFKYICSLFGSYQDECNTIVDSFGAQLALCLTTAPVNTTQCCADVFLCSSQQPEKLNNIRDNILMQFIKNRKQ